MTKKRIIILGIIILAVATIITIALSSKGIRERLPIRQPLPTGQLPKSQFIIPTGETTTVSNIQVKNFLKESKVINQNNDMAVSQTSEYEIIFFPQGDYFILSILGSPFSQARRLAEQTFIDKLGITEEKACLLNVAVTTPSFANPNESGQTYKLSFCE